MLLMCPQNIQRHQYRTTASTAGSVMANTVCMIYFWIQREVRKELHFVKLFLQKLRLVSYLCSAAGTEYPGTGSFVP